jgi:hypothetical protein
MIIAGSALFFCPVFDIFVYTTKMPDRGAEVLQNAAINQLLKNLLFILLIDLQLFKSIFCCKNQ